MSDRDIRPAGRYEWEHIVRRARFAGSIGGKTGRDGKATRGAMSELAITAIALCWASYADPDGTDVYAGDATIAVDLGTTIQNVATVRKLLLRLGLLAHVRGRRLGRGEEYRLTLPSDLIDVLDVPTPAQHKLAALRLREKARGKRGGSSGLPTGEPTPVDNPILGGPVDSPDDQLEPGPGGSSGHAQSDSGGSSGHALGGPVDSPTVHDRPPNTTDHSDGDLRTAVTAPRANGTEHKPESPPGRCPRHPAMPNGTDSWGRTRCGPCRSQTPRQPPLLQVVPDRATA